jgi:hypothetical protein
MTRTCNLLIRSATGPLTNLVASQLVQLACLNPIASPPPRACIHGYLHYSGRGRGRPANHPPPLNTSSHNTAARRSPHPFCTQQHTTTHNITQQHTTTHNNTQQHTTTLGYIKLPMYQLFLWRLYLMALILFWAQMDSLRSYHFRHNKVSIFRAHPFQCPS